MKQIKGLNGHYSITKDGKVWSHKSNRFLQQSPTPTSPYMYVRFCINGESMRKSVHRLVAETYINNPNNLPEVDHIDNNTLNNNYRNLQWITRKDNLYKSYNTMGPMRNFRNCKLYKGNNLLGTFKSVAECCRFCAKEYGLSFSSMGKYRSYGDYAIKCND